MRIVELAIKKRPMKVIQIAFHVKVESQIYIWEIALKNA